MNKLFLKPEDFKCQEGVDVLEAKNIPILKNVLLPTPRGRMDNTIYNEPYDDEIHELWVEITTTLDGNPSHIFVPGNMVPIFEKMSLVKLSEMKVIGIPSCPTKREYYVSLKKKDEAKFIKGYFR